MSVKVTISPEEEERLQIDALLPTTVIGIAYPIGYALLMPRHPLASNLWFLLATFPILWILLMFSTFFLSFEIYYSRKTGQPMSVNIGRFVNRIITLLGSVGLFVLVIALMYISLNPWFDVRVILFSAYFISLVLWAVLVSHFKEKLRYFLRWRI